MSVLADLFFASVQVRTELHNLEVEQCKDRQTLKGLTVRTAEWKEVKARMYIRRKTLHDFNKALTRSYR